MTQGSSISKKIFKPWTQVIISNGKQICNLLYDKVNWEVKTNLLYRIVLQLRVLSIPNDDPKPASACNKFTIQTKKQSFKTIQNMGVSANNKWESHPK